MSKDNMIHKGTVTLRRFTLDDAEAVFKNWASDPDVTKYLMWSTHESVSASKGWCEHNVDSYDDEKYYSWSLSSKHSVSQSEALELLSLMKKPQWRISVIVLARRGGGKATQAIF